MKSFLLIAFFLSSAASYAATCSQDWTDDSCKGAEVGTSCLANGNAAGICAARGPGSGGQPYCACAPAPRQVPVCSVSTCHREMSDDSCKGATPGSACLTQANTAGACVLRGGVPLNDDPYCSCR